MQHDIGGKESRGGLLVKRANVGNAFEELAYWDENREQVMTAFISKNLFFVKDIKKYNLLHHTVKDQDIELALYLTELDPKVGNDIFV